MKELGHITLDELEVRIKERMAGLEPDLYEYDDGAWDNLNWILRLIRLPN